MESDEFTLLPLSDSEKALLAEVKEAVLAAENSGAFDDAAAASANPPAAAGWEHPAVRFLASTFMRKCLTQLEVLRAHGVAYSLKELVWFVLNLERDPSYMLGLTGSDCNEEQVRSLAERLPQSPAISVPPEPLLLLPSGGGGGFGSDNGNCGFNNDEAASLPSIGGDLAEATAAECWPDVKEALERLRCLAEAAADAAADERRRPRRRGLPAERPVLTVSLPDLPRLPPCPLDPVDGGAD